MSEARPRIAAHRAMRRIAWAIFLALLTLTLAVAGATSWWMASLRPVDVRVANIETFEVQPGWGASRVAEELASQGLIRDDLAFSLWVRIQGLDRSIGEGLYDLSPSQSSREIAALLAAGGRPRTISLTIPEGWRAAQVAARVSALGFGSEQDTLALTKDPSSWLPIELPDGASAEGYLLPDTYEIRLDAEPVGVLRRPAEALATLLEGGLASRAETEGLSVHDLVTLASMVQAEAAGPEEMPIIAGVFRNRLDIGMPLQSDPTVAYGLGKTLPELSRPEGDFEVDHPWNTYTRSGLPFGPIGNPSKPAYDAVLAPDRLRADGTPWLYFLHGIEDGQPVFRPNTNLTEHLRDVNRFLR